MRKQIWRILAIALCLVLLMTILAACKNGESTGKESDVRSDVVSSGDGNGDESADEKTRYLPEKTDMDKYKLRMFSCADEARWFVYQEGIVGNTINQALYSRNRFMEEYFNIEISIENIYPSSELKTTLDMSVSGNQDFADILFLKSQDALATAAPKGQIVQLNNKEGFNLSASYWDQRIQKDFDINGRLFLLEGDFSVYDELRTDGILYNKAMYESLGHKAKYGSLAELVKEGGWTFELLKTLVKEGSEDVDKDGLDKDDTIGFITNDYAPYCYFLGSGNKIVSNVEGRMVLHLDENYTTVTNILSDTLGFFVNSPDVVMVTKEFFGTSNIMSAYRAANQMMLSGKNYLQGCTLIDAMQLTNMKEDFGLLPIPKYSEDQDGYYCWLGDGNALTIPSTAYANMDKIVTLAEAFCYFSCYDPGGNQSLRNAFFDNLSTTSLCRTAEDYEIMELIFASKTFDIDRACAISGIPSLTLQLKVGTFSSDVAGLRTAANTNMNNYLTNILTNSVS